MKYLPIAFISDRNFFLPTIVAITSLLENKLQKSTYVIYVICVGFTEEQLSKIELVEHRYNTEIKIIQVDEKDLRDKYSGLAKHDCNATISALIKFDLPYICSVENRLLYLDGDIIVKSDLSSFLDIDMGDDVYVAAVRDSGLLYSKRLIRQGNTEYFNSGVMYLNLEAMRNDEVSEKLVEAKRATTDNSLMDQHVLNKVLGEKKKLIDYRYNTLYVNLRRAHYFHSLGIDEVKKFCRQQYANWEDILEQAFIVHYSSFDKPWKYADANGVELWDKYFQMSMVKDMSIRRKRLYTNVFERIMKHRFLRPFGIVMWELNTKGVIKSAKEVVGLFKTR